MHGCTFEGSFPPYITEEGLHIDRYGGALDNHAASKKALRYPAGKGVRSRGKEWLKGYVGLRDYDDIVHGKATVPYMSPGGMSASQLGVDTLDVGPKFTVAIEQPMDTIRTSSHIEGLGGPPDFEAPDKAIQDKLTAISTAQVYFSRPRGFGLFDNVIDSRREMGSLFSPNWQARLVETPCKLKTAIAVSYGSVAPCNPLN